MATAQEIPTFGPLARYEQGVIERIQGLQRPSARVAAPLL